MDNKQQHHSVPTAGFTLVELMIAITILAFISMFTAQSIRQAARSKVKIQKDLDVSSVARDALNILRADIRSAFHYRDINIELYNKAIAERKKRSTQDTPQDQTPPEDEETPAPTTPQTSNDNNNNLEPKKEVVLTHFLGEEDNLHFTTLNNIRMFSNSQISDQAEVGYYVKSCSSRIDKSIKSNCLWRRHSPYIDDRVDKGGDAIVLLENVTEFKLRYKGRQKEEEWVGNWKTNENGDEVTRGVFPYAVEIRLTVEQKNESKSKNQKTKSVSMFMIAPIRFPNNKTNEDPDSDESKGNQNVQNQ